MATAFFPRVMPTSLAWTAGVLLFWLASCSSTKSSLEPLEPTGIDRPALELGEFRLAEDPVIDGDTIQVAGLDQSLRLLAIDTEETFQSPSAQREASVAWERYVAEQQAGAGKPVKFGTPLGEKAKRFAQKFFADVTRVRLERDHPNQTRGRYNRLLAYVLAERDGKWVNYNVECVRAGMSPYFAKYGYSRRYHAELEEAQAQARAAKRGVWSPKTRHYPDYDERLAWWRARADLLRDFEREAAGNERYVVLTHRDAMARLERLVGESVVVLGLVGHIAEGPGQMARVYLSHRKGRDLPLIFFDRATFDGSRIQAFELEFVRVQGEVTRYSNPRTDKEVLQIEVRHPNQVQTRATWPPPGSRQARPRP